MLEKKNGRKSIVKTPEIDDDTRACIRNFRVDAIVGSFEFYRIKYKLTFPLTESRSGFLIDLY